MRESNFSLKIRAIRPSAVFGTRRRTALREEDFAWVPDLGSFLKLREVGVSSPYLGFIPALSTLQMFESNEAVRDRLIGPKPCIDCNEAGYGRKNAGSQGEPMICDFPGIVIESFTILETVFSNIYFCENMCLVE